MSPENHLTETQNVILILRLMLDARGDLARGELVDVHAASLGWFKDWPGLQGRLQEWLKKVSPDDPTRGF